MCVTIHTYFPQKFVQAIFLFIGNIFQQQKKLTDAWERCIYIQVCSGNNILYYLPFPFLYLLTYSVLNLLFKIVSIKKKN